jgi:hypothetical protein
MKTVCALMLTCLTVVAASAGDSAELIGDRLIFCDQLVFKDPNPSLARYHARSCCGTASRFRDCRAQDWHETHR